MRDSFLKHVIKSQENEAPFKLDGKDGLLEKCPRCLYLLQGLPIEHHCPECGLRVDRRWQVFGGRTIPKNSKPMGNIMGAFLIFILGYPVTILTATVIVGGVGVKFLSIPFLLLVVFSTLAWFFLKKPKCFVAVGPRGLAIYFGRDCFEEYEWTGIGRVLYEIGHKRINIPREGGDIHLTIFKFFGMHIGEVDRCVQGINHYPRPEQPE